jgi:uncharacterized BrkB/YihY/UPF0761 family membrane protein
MFFGLILVAIGIIALLIKADVLSGSVWNYAWPVILIILGLSFLFGRMFRRRRWWWFCGPPWDDRDRPNKE